MLTLRAEKNERNLKIFLECLPKDPTEDEIQSLLRQLETMEDVDNCEELQSQIMETIQGYPELLMAMKQFNNEHAFEKEKVEFERLKLEEQISMLEKVIENGIKQTTDLQEIHHVEVDDLHNQVREIWKPEFVKSCFFRSSICKNKWLPMCASSTSTASIQKRSGQRCSRISTGLSSSSKNRQR